MHVIPALGFDLQRELAAKRPVHAALAPQRQVAVGGDALTEIQRAEILQHLFDDGPMSASLRRHRPQWVDCDVERRLFERDLEWLGGDLALKL